MSTDPETPDLHEESAMQDEDQLDSEAEDDGVDDTALQEQEDEEDRADQTLQNGKPYAEVDESTDYSVFSNPPNLADMRQKFFDIEQPMEMPVADFEAYFPFVDNIWRKMRSTDSPLDTTFRADYYACRLRRGANQKPHIPRPTPEGKQPRKKRVRDDKTCGMTMKVVYKPGTPQTCTISRAVDSFMKHSHDLNYIDATKRNAGIMDTARREGTKGFLPASIHWKMWEEPEKMEAAGGKFMKMSDVRNVQYAWRQENQQTVLKAHKGFNQTRGGRHRPATPPRLIQPPMQPGVFGRLEPVKAGARSDRPPVPMDTLQYPQHARGFLEQFLPGANPSPARTRPHVTLTWASSLDGRISQIPGVPTPISGPETKAMTHYLRSRHDAILVGVSTAIADDPALNCRLANGVGFGGLSWDQQPRPIIIDPHARLVIRPEMKVLQAAAEGRGKAPWVVVAPGAMLHPTAVSILKAHGGEYLMINDYHPQSGGLNWEGIFHVLSREGIKSVMVEGGGVVLSELLKMQYAHLIDSLVLTIAPTFFGRAGVMVSPDPAFDPTGRPIASRLRNVRWQPMGEADVVLCGNMGTPPLPPPPPPPVHAPPPPTNGILAGIEEFSKTAPEPPRQGSNQPPPQPPPPNQAQGASQSPQQPPAPNQAQEASQPSQQSPPPNQTQGPTSGSSSTESPAATATTST